VTTDGQYERCAVVAEGWDDGESDDETEEVGWMYMEVSKYVQACNGLENSYGWMGIYQRPCIANLDLYKCAREYSKH